MHKIKITAPINWRVEKSSSSSSQPKKAPKMASPMKRMEAEMGEIIFWAAV